MVNLYVNGRILPEAEAVVSANDRAILFGDAAYETMRSYAGKFFRFPEHLRRLRDTLRGMELDLPASDEDITRGAADLVAANRVPDARLRLTVTGGHSDGAIRLRRSHPPNLIMTATPLVPPPAEAYRDGVEVLLSAWRVHSDSPLPRIKTVNRLMHLMAKELAIAAGAWETLFTDEADCILEGTATNVFFVIGGTLRTGSLDEPLLAGVTRDAILETARRESIPVGEGPVTVAEARGATEAFLSSTTIELLPIRRLGDEVVGEGKPGPIWRRLHAGYRKLVSTETGVSFPEP